MIFSRVRQFLRRVSDIAYQGRNNALIWLGTDRKDTINSGWGDGGKNDPNAGAIYIGVGLQRLDGNLDFIQDEAHIYLSEKCNPDEYFVVNKGPRVEGDPAIIVHSNNVYLLGRDIVKIIAGQNSIIIDPENGITVDSPNKITVKSPNVLIDNGGSAERRVITEDDVATGIDPITGAEIPVTFKAFGQNPGQQTKINIQNTKIK